eukprot:Sspe_Gene.30278::Locus_14931_Transcript_1_1_Confidence_1.000_Length_1241::g.30278::m.30278
MLIIVAYTYRSSKKKNKGKPWNEWKPPGRKPLFLICLAVPLILAETMRHVLQDTYTNYGYGWPECGDNDVFPRINQTWNDHCVWSSSQYRCEKYCCVPQWNETCGPHGDWCGGVIPLPPGEDCTCHCIDDETMKNLSPMGWLFTFTFTYTGFALLFIGVMWNADIMQQLRKIHVMWKVMRAEDKFDDEKEWVLPRHCTVRLDDDLSEYHNKLFQVMRCDGDLVSVMLVEYDCKSEYEAETLRSQLTTGEKRPVIFVVHQACLRPVGNPHNEAHDIQEA